MKQNELQSKVNHIGGLLNACRLPEMWSSCDGIRFTLNFLQLLTETMQFRISSTCLIFLCQQHREQILRNGTHKINDSAILYSFFFLKCELNND